MTKIKEARHKAGLSQQKMADLTGIPRRTIEDWERGVRTPPEWAERLIVQELLMQTSTKLLDIKRRIKMPNESKRQSIYLSPLLREVYNEAEERETGFSRLLTEYVERYKTMVRMVKLPELTDHEKMILGEVVSGSMVTPEMLVAMGWSINDAESGTPEEKEALIQKVKTLRPAERMALVDMIENLGRKK